MDPILKGTHVVFAAGTGILPFLDLIALTLRFVCNKAKNVKILYDEKFENISDDFKLVVFVSFVDVKGSVYKQECEMLQEICKSYNLNHFSYHCRLSATDKTKWDTAFMSKQLKPLGQMEKIQIVGPIGFMDAVRESIKGYDSNLGDKIFLP